MRKPYRTMTLRFGLLLSSILAVGCPQGVPNDPVQQNDNVSDDSDGSEHGLPITTTRGGISLDALSSMDTEDRTTSVSHDGVTLLHMRITSTEMRLSFPTENGNGEIVFQFDKPLQVDPSDASLGSLATLIVGEVFFPQDTTTFDSPGCTWVPDSLDTTCRLRCCAVHDQCYNNHGCDWTSWLLGPTQRYCFGCNSNVVDCWLHTCTDDEENQSGGDTCYDHICGKSYTCPDNHCNCRSPCDCPEGKIPAANGVDCVCEEGCPEGQTQNPETCECSDPCADLQAYCSCILPVIGAIPSIQGCVLACFGSPDPVTCADFCGVEGAGAAAMACLPLAQSVLAAGCQRGCLGF